MKITPAIDALEAMPKYEDVFVNHETGKSDNGRNVAHYHAMLFSWYERHKETIRAALTSSQENVHGSSSLTAPEVVTVEDMSRHIQAWRFDDQYNYAFGEYLRKKYPHGIKIIGGEG